jgi:prepilin-type N-terminal cleavage/methylation domain-containing protein
MKRRPRRGFSLMEILLATSILLACVVVLAELAEVGRRHAVSVDQLTTAQMICQSKLNEIVAGAAPLSAVEAATVAEAPDWVYSVELESMTNLDLVVVRVTVEGQPQDDATTRQRPKKSFSLTRWMHRTAPGNGMVPQASDLPDLPADFGLGEDVLP